MGFGESIRKVARRLADGHAEHVCDRPGGIPVNRTVLRSIAAILSGWLVTVGGYVVTMVVIALLDPEAFKPALHYSTGYWLVTLSVGLICSVVGGFVTGVIARRREIAHAIGLVLFGLLASKCWPSSHTNTMSVPNWYWVAGYVLMPLSTILGGWLRAKQHLLVRRIPGRVVRTIDDLRLSTVLTVDFFRFPIAVVVSVGAFVISFYVGILSAGAGLLAIQRLLGGEPRGDVGVILVSLVFLASFLLAFVLSRCVYRRIMLRETSLMDDRRQE